MLESVQVRLEVFKSLLASGDGASPEKELEDALRRLLELRQGAGPERQKEYELALDRVCELYELRVKQRCEEENNP